jgi:hypothetical protein
MTTGKVLKMQEMRNASKKTAVIVGVLFIIGTIAGVLSVITTGSVFEGQNFLTNVAGNETRVALGALFVLTMGLSLAMVPVVIYPVLKKHNDVLALGYVVFRGALEPITYIGSVLSWLLLIPLSREYGSTAVANAAALQSMGTMILEAGKISATLCSIVFPLGAIMLYAVLYQSKLIPRWLSVWGMAAVVLHMVVTGFGGLFSITSSLSTIQDIMAFPIFLQEMVMAVWLIVKGFNPAAITARTDYSG